MSHKDALRLLICIAVCCTRQSEGQETRTEEKTNKLQLDEVVFVIRGKLRNNSIVAEMNLNYIQNTTLDVHSLDLFEARNCRGQLCLVTVRKFQETDAGYNKVHILMPDGEIRRIVFHILPKDIYEVYYYDLSPGTEFALKIIHAVGSVLVLLIAAVKVMHGIGKICCKAISKVKITESESESTDERATEDIQEHL